MMKHTLTTLMVVALVVTTLVSVAAHAQGTSSTRMALGADVSWCTEMEADGRRFYNADGTETELFALLRALGMNAVRLRVWVNPERFGYGAWCDKADVVNKAKRAHAQGLDIMIDFHYSDCFADPGTQTLPLDWTGYSLAQVKSAVAAHTKDVLQALKDEGITPRWVQAGNETNNGMVWETGKINWDKSGTARYTNYVALSNAAYDAVKAILPDALVILHYAGAYNAADWDGWFFKDFKAAGGKFDIIGLSHYPDYNNWASQTAGALSNVNAAKSVETLGKLYNVPVMICETGYSNYDPNRASQVMNDLMQRLSALPQCAGVFYWEPEVDGKWKPAYYNTLGWNAYQMGAFTADGKPTAALAAFRDKTTALPSVPEGSPEGIIYDLLGRRLPSPLPNRKGTAGNAFPKGLYILNGKKVAVK